MQHRSTRDLQPSVRAPDTRTAPTSAYLSNYRYRAYRRPPVGLRQPPISLPVYICTCTATISAADLTRENCDIRFLPTFACGSNVPIGGLAR